MACAYSRFVYIGFENTSFAAKIVNITFEFLCHMDRLDAKIIEILRSDSRTPNVEIADKLGVTEGTVRNRIRRMVADRTIRGFTVDAVESGGRAILLIKTKADRTAFVVRAVQALALEIFEMAGPYDVAILLRCEDIDHLNTNVDQIRAIRGVMETQTLVALASNLSVASRKAGTSARVR